MTNDRQTPDSGSTAAHYAFFYRSCRRTDSWATVCGAQQTGLVMNGWGNHDCVCHENSNRSCGVRGRGRCRTHTHGGRSRGTRAQLPVAGIGAGLCDPEASPNCDVTVSPFAIPSGTSSIVVGQHPILQNPLWWFGTPNPTPPTPTTVFTFYPLALVPGFIRPLFGWFNDINFEACIAGLTFARSGLTAP